MANPVVVYLLHFVLEPHGTRHYLGSTTLNRLSARMMDHANGRGAALTRALSRTGAHFDLVAYWPVDSRNEERRLHRAGHLARRCPICSLATPAQVLGPPKGPLRYFPPKPTQAMRTIDY